MRVVAGEFGGRRLEAPRGSTTRPTGDRVREAMFNALGSRSIVVGARVVDLFAGSGALGIEALSRGASHVTFVDSDRSAVATIRANLASLGVEDRTTVLATRVEAVLDALAGEVDLVLADPPYAFDGWVDLLDGLSPVLSPVAVVVIESDRPLTLPAGWQKARERTYGGTVVTFADRTDADETTGVHE